MTNKNLPIRQKTFSEVNKDVWILKNPEGIILETYRGKSTAMKEKKRREKLYFGVELILERDNSYTENLKENLNVKKSSLWRV